MNKIVLILRLTSLIIKQLSLFGLTKSYSTTYAKIIQSSECCCKHSKSEFIIYTINPKLQIRQIPACTAESIILYGHKAWLFRDLSPACTAESIILYGHKAWLSPACTAESIILYGHKSLRSRSRVVWGHLKAVRSRFSVNERRRRQHRFVLVKCS